MIDNIIIEAMRYAKRERLKDMAVPFALLYEKLVRQQEIKPLTELPVEMKRRYWNEVKDVQAKTFNKKTICQALYVFDIIKNQIQ